MASQQGGSICDVISSDWVKSKLAYQNDSYWLRSIRVYSLGPADLRFIYKPVFYSVLLFVPGERHFTSYLAISTLVRGWRSLKRTYHLYRLRSVTWLIRYLSL